MPDSPLTVNYSRLKTWRSCQQLHNYKYVQGLEPRRKAEALFRGSIIHEMIEAVARGGTQLDVAKKYRKMISKMFKEEQAEYMLLLQDVEDIMTAYFKFWEKDPFNFVLLEHTVGPVKLTDRTQFKGKVDGLHEDKKGRFWLVEHKSHKRLPTGDAQLFDLQTLLYAWALRKEGYQVDGILWDFIRTKPPAIPKVLKNGSLSKRANIDTLYDTYFKAIVDHGLDPANYEAILSSLKGKEDTFFRRMYLPIGTESTMRRIVQDARATSLEIYHLQAHPVRSLSRYECPRCSYSSLCNAELRDMDVDFLKKADYKIDFEKEYAHDQEEEE